MMHVVVVTNNKKLARNTQHAAHYLQNKVGNTLFWSCLFASLFTWALNALISGIVRHVSSSPFTV